MSFCVGSHHRRGQTALRLVLLQSSHFKSWTEIKINNLFQLIYINMETRIGGKYLLKRKIGSGSFGDIYLGTHIKSGVDVAIKLERR